MLPLVNVILLLLNLLILIGVLVYVYKQQKIKKDTVITHTTPFEDHFPIGGVVYPIDLEEFQLSLESVEEREYYQEQKSLQDKGKK